MTDTQQTSGGEGNFLRSLLEGNDINQQELADKTCTSRTAINQVMNSKRSISPLMALKLEAALGVSARSLLENQLVSDLDRVYRENRELIEDIRSDPMFPKAN